MGSQLEYENYRITEEALEGLPVIVQKYLVHTGIIGRYWIDTVRLKQVGRFRQSRDHSWMPVTAVETYSTNPPGFEWDARFKVAGIPLLRAKDRYESGHGHMFGKLAGLLTVFDDRGEQIDQASLMRYLNEMMWFPTAFLGSNITWTAIDEHIAEVMISDKGHRVSATMYFDAIGQLINFTAMRYRENEGEFSLDPWSTPVTGYGKLEGLNLPISGHAVWNLPEGDLSYAELEVVELHYHTAEQSSGT